MSTGFLILLTMVSGVGASLLMGWLVDRYYRDGSYYFGGGKKK
jgi:F0F1-type ATP synthase assembly protein I